MNFQFKKKDCQRKSHFFAEVKYVANEPYLKGNFENIYKVYNNNNPNYKANLENLR